MEILFILLMGSQVLGQVFDTTPFPTALTSFTCHGRPPGYYADIETGCKTYHVCDGNSHFTYVCPKRTLFQQRSRICDHSYLVRCEDSPHFFYETENIFGSSEEIFIPLNESQDESLSNTGFFEENYNQTEESFTSGTTTPTELEVDEEIEITTTEKHVKELNLDKEYTKPIESIEKFLKLRLKDSRSLFFIPQFQNNSIDSILSNSEREFLLPLQKNDFMKFRNRKKGSVGVADSVSVCPSHCNPKFFLPGFCHPCIMIK